MLHVLQYVKGFTCIDEQIYSTDGGKSHVNWKSIRQHGGAVRRCSNDMG